MIVIVCTLAIYLFNHFVRPLRPTATFSKKPRILQFFFRIILLSSLHLVAQKKTVISPVINKTLFKGCDWILSST